VSAAFTPGPWQVNATVQADRRNIFGLNPTAAFHVGTLVSGSKSKLSVFDANARLIAAAPDHALICWAMCVQDARWEEWVPFDGKGEFCFAGLRHATSLDEFGCPRLTDTLRTAIANSQTVPA
jgi:hypothetical protein